MKLSTTIFLTIFASLILLGQDSKWPKLDASSMDVAYYPANVAWRNYLGPDQRNITPKLKVVYSRPQMKERTIFGNLVPFGQEWRLGANEATLLTTYQSVAIGDQVLAPGVYSVFAEVNEGEWTFHISSEITYGEK